MFTQKVTDLSISIQAQNLIVSYLLKLIGAREFRSEAKQLKGERPKLLELKSFVDSSLYIAKLWRCVYKYCANQLEYVVKEYGIDPGDVNLFIDPSLIEMMATDNEVEIEDVYFCLDVLSSNQVAMLQRQAINTPINPLSESQIADIVTGLTTYCSRLANHKLRFLAKFDSGLTLEDLTGDLIAEAVRIVRIYDYTGDVALVTNYAKRAVHNLMVDFTTYYTYEMRSRVQVVNGEYQSKTVSFEPFHSPADIFEDYAEHKDFLEYMTKGMTGSTKSFLQVIMGKNTKEFDAWLKTKGLSYDVLSSSDHDTLTSQATQFYGIDPSHLQEVVLEKLSLI